MSCGSTLSPAGADLDAVRGASPVDAAAWSRRAAELLRGAGLVDAARAWK
jgi:hypothetical protein